MKESLNSDGPQFQQNNLKPLNIKTSRKPVQDLGKTQKCGGVKPVNGIPSLLLHE